MYKYIYLCDMNKVILQRWEESERGWGVNPDGCSLHLNLSYRDLYVSDIYCDRGDDVPDVYERLVGSPIEVFIDDELFSILEERKNLRLQEHELNNLINLEELIVK